jgi:hypothetical protein
MPLERRRDAAHRNAFARHTGSGREAGPALSNNSKHEIRKKYEARNPKQDHDATTVSDFEF